MGGVGDGEQNAAGDGGTTLAGAVGLLPGFDLPRQLELDATVDVIARVRGPQKGKRLADEATRVLC